MINNREQRTYQKQVYKRTSQKYYIKGDSNVSRKEIILELLARIIAMLFYPIYILIMAFNKIAKSIKKKVNLSSLQLKFSEIKMTIAERVKPNQSQNPYQKLVQMKQNHQKQNPKKSSYKQTKSKDKARFNQKGSNFTFAKVAETIKTNAQKGFDLALANRMIAAGVLVTVLALSGGAFALSNLKPSDLAGSLESQFVSVSVDQNVPKPLTEKPEINDLSFTAFNVYQLTSNNQVLANFRTEEEGNAVLEQLMNIYTTGTEVTILDSYFNEDVKVIKGFVDITKFNGYDNVDNALAFIMKGTKEVKTHKVQKGENLWTIATYYGINPSDLEKANPQIKPETLQIDQEISLVVPKPLISVCTVEEVEYSTEIPFQVVYEETSSLYKDESKTKVKGVLGEKAIVAKITRINGRELGRIIVSENIVAEPQSKVVYKGTKDPPPKMGSGVLSKPTSRGAVTSEFGTRWGRRHEGVDIGLPTGSDVKAADGGVVTFSGYNSSYGNYIIIDHGGNITTLYAHNSKLLLKKGEKVYKGQLIAKSGNTGRSTGPHLHFEVRKKGVPQNPRNYVNF